MNATRRTPRKEVWMYVPDGRKLKRARLRVRLSQAELARAAGVSQQYVSLLELGRDKDCSEKVAISICRWLQVDVEDYFRPGSPVSMSPVATPSRVSIRDGAA